MKKRTLGLGILMTILVGVIAIGTSLAYLTDKEDKDNVFEIGAKIDVEVDEPGYVDPKPDDVKPGMTILKDPVMTNKGSEAYVRFRVEFLDLKGYNTVDNKKLPITEAITDPIRIEKLKESIFYDTEVNLTQTPPLTPNILKQAYKTTDLANLLTENKITKFNTDEFVLDTARTTGNVMYYNYIGGATANPALLAKDASTCLFTNIVIPEDWDNDAFALIKGANKGFVIRVTGEAIQNIDSITSAEAAYALLDAERAK